MMKTLEGRAAWLAAATLAIVPCTTAFAQTTQEQQAGYEAQKQQAARDQTPAAVSINTLEENAMKYRGQTVKVTGEVDEVLGPRMFKIDEREWLDFDGETLVFALAPLTMFVNEGEAVTVTGTLRTIMDVDLQKEWGWFELEPDVEAELNKRNVIVATGVVTSTGAARLMDPSTPEAVGTSGSSKAALTDVAMLAKSEDNRLVGRKVDLNNVKAVSIAKAGGFWVNAGSDTLFVLPASADTLKVNPGDTVSISGVVLSMPQGMNERVSDRKMAPDEEIYVYADEIKTGK